MKVEPQEVIVVRDNQDAVGKTLGNVLALFLSALINWLILGWLNVEWQGEDLSYLQTLGFMYAIRIACKPPEYLTWTRMKK